MPMHRTPTGRALTSALIAALTFTALYLVIALAQRILLTIPGFVDILGPSSPFVVGNGGVGVNALAPAVDAVVLALMINRYGRALRGLAPAIVAAESVVISIAAFLVFMSRVHGLSGYGIYELTAETMLYSSMIGLIAATLTCRSLGKSCGEPGSLILVNYVAVLMIDYITDTADAMVTAAIPHQHPVIGALGPLDGLVIDPLLMAFLVWLITKINSVRKWR